MCTQPVIQMALAAVTFTLLAAAQPALADIAPDTVQQLLADDKSSDDGFGYSVSVSGSTAVIGALCENEMGSCAGAAYVFVKNGDVWTQQAKLLAADGSPDEYFGGAVAVSGSTALIGVGGDAVGVGGDYHAGDRYGSAYVFIRKQDGKWAQQAKLTALDGSIYQHFGSAVSLDGNTALIGAWGDDDKGDHSGAAYVFVRNGSTWKQQAKLIAADGSADDWFGRAVALKGGTAVIGAWGDNGKGNYSGSAYVFALQTDGTWKQQAKLIAADASEYDAFGYSVSADGDFAVIGAAGDAGQGECAGAAYVFVRAEDGTWKQQAKLAAADGSAWRYFGSSVSVNNGIILIGAHGIYPYSGAVYEFVRSQTAGAWTEKAEFTASASGYDYFGMSLSADSGNFLIGAAWQGSMGSAYAFGSPPNLLPAYYLLLKKW